MAQVTVKVNGYVYTVGCEDGQEAHLQAMAAQVDSRIDSIKALGGPSGESRLLLLASLLMADEIHDIRAELEQLRALVKRTSAIRTTAEPAVDAATTKRLGDLAKRAEEIADSMERP
ncbi:Cell division protein ZapA [Rhodovastum atsumiense]|uniref:Cell division protein ZapA n=1 Tax=Rhodovastum atsumiense TaxID=504468 RepID=A0A5M6IL86_9PROT|nr:cell division protein ZapA [Rhodovastum atsumiense]KAA5609030.1 cell division protein ZapA [Rhodovastum atsumiense]CAH2604668.1 Cell division protein ZapA [Rhodovastum atsumiense]